MNIHVLYEYHQSLCYYDNKGKLLWLINVGKSIWTYTVSFLLTNCLQCYPHNETIKKKKVDNTIASSFYT